MRRSTMLSKPFVYISVVLMHALVVVGAGYTAEPILMCDAGDGAVQDGWTKVGPGQNQDVAGTGISVTLATGNGDAIEPRSVGGEGPLADVEADFYFADNEASSPGADFILILSNLPDGNYILKSFHNRTNEADTTIPGVTVTGAINVTVPDSILQSHAIMDNPAEILFRAVGEDVVIRYQGPQGQCKGCQAFFNGFILESGTPAVQFDSPESGALETETPAILTVVVSEAQPEPVSVDYAVTGGTAIPGEDYTLEPGTLIFEPNETTKTIAIDIVNDGADEEDETIEVTLSNLQAGEVELGSRTQHTYTIIDPRPAVGFAETAGNAQEDSGSADVVMSLSWASEQTVTVDYAVTGGTAEGNGVDYTLADGSLAFAPGETTQTITIELVDDEIEEWPDETVELTLSNQTNAKLGIAQHTFTISDMGPIWRNSVGMIFVRVMPGSFTMGEGDWHRIQDNGDLDYEEQPAHKVMISKPFYLLRAKVSDSIYRQAGLGGRADDVSWDNATAFCEWLSQQDGYTYRLPTEAEWEYVQENPGEVQGMDGREWTYDWHAEYINDGQVDPVGPPTGFNKVIRNNGRDRYSLPTNATYDPWELGQARACGFRVVMVFDAPTNPYIAPPPFCQAAVKQNLDVAKIGPDPNIPYFTVRFSMPIPPDNVDDGTFTVAGGSGAIMHHSHSPGFEVMPNGDALAVWFTAHRSEYADDVRFVQARLRYGSDIWEMPELFWDMKGMNDESGLLWTEADGTVHFFGGGRIGNSERRPFVMAISKDSGATWDLKRPYFPEEAHDFTAQPITNGFRRDANTIYTVIDGSGSQSILWESTDNGVTWRDTGGRTAGRHSTIVPINNMTRLLALGGKKSDIDGYMPQVTSDNWGRNWGDKRRTPFSYLGSNQRPCVTRMQNGKLAFCTDAQRRGGDRPDLNYPRGCIVAISDNEGDSWHIKNLPVTLPHESDREDGTLGYSTIRQAPNGVLHILSTMTHPCLHYEVNEAWVFSGAGDIRPETSGGTVNSYTEYYPSGKLRATWSARTCANGRYLLDGKETFYFENGRKQYECTYENGKKVGTETYRTPAGIKLWSWEYGDASSTTAKWIHYWSNGLKRIESNWQINPVPPRDSNRHFSGRIAQGACYHWNRDGSGAGGYSFDNGELRGGGGNPPAQSRPDIDLPAVLSHWLWTGMPGDAGYNPADLNADGLVNFTDLAILASQQ